MVAAGDSLQADSVVADTSTVFYGIPSIVSPSHATDLDKALYQEAEITLENYELRTADIFFHTPFLYSDPRHQIHLLTLQNPTVLINNHQIDNPFLGQIDFALLPVQLFEKISLYEIYSGEHALAINFISKINGYERPFSFIRFTTLGDDNMYNIDFTRAFSTKTGFYFSGLYANSYMPYDSLYNKTNAYYTHLYQNTFFSKRLDIFYASNNYGTMHSADLFDIDFVIGNDKNNACIYYNNSSMDVSSLLPNTIINNTLTALGINTKSIINLKGLELDFGTDGSVKTLESEIYSDSQYANINFWQKCGGSFGRFLFGYAQSINFCGLLDDTRIYFKPKASIGTRTVDSLFVIYSLSYYIHEPALVQKSGTCGVPLLSYSINGNPALLNEKILRHQVSFRKNNFNLCFYSSTSCNFIFYREDSTGYYHPENRNTWSVRGIENCVTLPLAWNFSIGHAGSYILSGDSLARLPKMIHNVLLSWTRPTERSKLTLVFKTGYIGERVSFSQQNQQPFYILSTACLLRFMTLSLSAVFDNMLNESRVDYPNFARNFSLSVKWEFWD